MQIVDATIDRKGTLFVLDGSTSQVHVFTGSAHRTFSRRGAGPGESSSPRSLGRLHDTLVVIDGIHRVHYFGPSGTLYQTRVAAAPGADRQQGVIAAASAGGVMISGRPLQLPGLPEGDGIVQAWALFRVDYAGRSLNRIGSYEPFVLPLALTVRRDGQITRAHTREPFRDDPLLAQDRDGRVVYLLLRRTSAEGPHRFRLIGLSIATGDTVLDRSYTYTPKPLTRALLDAKIDELERDLRRNMPAMSPVSIDRQEAQEEIYRPFHLPTVERVLVGRDGTLWLRRETTGPLASYTVLSPKGDPLGTVRLPAAVKIVEATARRVWVITKDADDVESVTWYRVGR
jgi:hypothetical protein